MSESGHGLGNHTWSHPFLPDLSVAEFAVQLERTDEAMAAAGRLPERQLFRPPYGSRTPEALSWLAAQQAGPTMVLWDVDACDWAMPGAAAIAGTVLDQARPGSVVLMHDGGGDRSQTVEALPAIIEGLLADGEPAAAALNAGYHLAYLVGAGLIGLAILVALVVLRPDRAAEQQAGAAMPAPEPALAEAA